MDDVPEIFRKFAEDHPLPAPRRPLPDPEMADATTLASTEVGPTLHIVHEEGKNLLWCSTAELAWRALGEFVGGPVALDPPMSLADQLNTSVDAPVALSGSELVALAGLVEDGIVERIRAEVTDKFGREASAGVDGHLRSGAVPGGLLALAMLRKPLRFAFPFQSQEGGLSCRGVEVEQWGFWFDDEQRPHQARQVEVLDYQSPMSFLLEIATTSPDDRLLIARRAPSRTLDDTVRDVLALSTQNHGVDAGSVGRSERFAVPVIDFDLVKSYLELAGHRVTNPGFVGLPILDVLQSIRFRLDESGAVLLSWSLLAIGAALHPRRFVCDGPFLVLLVGRADQRPYFALWVENTELMVRSRGANPGPTQR